jgi:Flp pilus assembly protein TadG
MRRHFHRFGRQRSHERGAAAVEFALVLPLVATLLLGIITGGMAFTRGIGLSNAVREGARFGATADASSGGWAQDVIDRVRETQFDDEALAADSYTTVCVELVGGATPVPATCSTSGMDSALPTPTFPSTVTVPALGPDECLVKVWANRNFKISLAVAPTLENDMLRYSVARYERDC